MSEKMVPLSSLEAVERENERLKTLNAYLIMQARGHAQEARTANGTIYEIYQAISGGKGEPGNWHGAQPVRDFIATAEASLAAAREVLSSFHITVVEASFYKDVTLHLDAPHALSIRIRNDSSKSWIFKDLDDRRRAALAGSNGE